MANEQIKQNYKDIANAIRSKTGENGLMTAEEMPAKIEAIETGITPSGTKNITTNGNHDVTNYATAHVNVAGYPEPTGTKSITENGTNIDVKDYAKANVNVQSNFRLYGIEILTADTESFPMPTINWGNISTIYIYLNQSSYEYTDVADASEWLEYNIGEGTASTSTNCPFYKDNNHICITAGIHFVGSGQDPTFYISPDGYISVTIRGCSQDASDFENYVKERYPEGVAVTSEGSDWIIGYLSWDSLTFIIEGGC